MSKTCQAEAITGEYGCFLNCVGVKGSPGISKQIDFCVLHQKAHREEAQKIAETAEKERHRREAERQAIEANRHRNNVTIINALLTRAITAKNVAEESLTEERNRAQQLATIIQLIEDEHSELDAEHLAYKAEKDEYLRVLTTLYATTLEDVHKMEVISQMAHDISNSLDFKARRLEEIALVLGNVRASALLEEAEHTQMRTELAAADIQIRFLSEAVSALENTGLPAMPSPVAE
ncbi:MAG: hypothetical protein Q8S21_04585 [Candidatus Paracaedibacteraceae bacterium]|nr:hypothetical protein [Candidatus Paracaedibacteraceae bacterium]